MTRSVHYSRIFVSIALVFCMLFSMMGIVDASSYTNTLYPLGSNSRATRTLTPERHTIKIYISGGKSGSALKKDSLPGWITVNSSNADYFIATVTGNTTTSVRSGSIVFTKGSNKYELYVTQNAFKVSTSAGGSNVSSLKFDVAGGTKSFYTNYPCNISGTIPDWLTVTPSGNTYTLTARPNLFGSNRSCTLSFTKTLSTYEKVIRTVTITQGANGIHGVPTSLAFRKDGPAVSIMMKAGYGTVTATVGSRYTSWLKVSKNGDTFTFSCIKNDTGSSRTGYVTVKAGNITKTITITQYGG